MDKYDPLVKPGGVLVVNSTLVSTRSKRDDITVLYVPANDLATELGNVKMSNVVLLGALLAAKPILSAKAVKQAMDDHIPERRKQIIEPNKRALDRGIEYVRKGK
jgi:2-oxoglutarate ferredoxin oxidoreductase subunit gamma